MSCDVDSEMKPFLGDPYIILYFQSTPTFFKSCMNVLLSQAFGSLFLLRNRISPGPAARDQLPKVGGGSSSGCPFLSWSLPSTALRILNELVYLNSKHE